MQKNVFVDGKAILNQGTIYAFEVGENRTYQVVISAQDIEQDLQKEIPLTFIVQRPDIIGKLLVSPDTGFEPLTVELDASQTELTLPNDTIEYFSWDFGDGETKQNLPGGKISHTYKYDYTKENGRYLPKVSVLTRKGLSLDITYDLGILVKKQLVQIDLSSPSHPTQIAKIGTTVNFLSEFNGLPETMKWDFGDGSTPYQCKGRACTEVTHSYTKAGNYKVTVSLEFDDLQMVEALMEMKIN
jgi:hypothetical protein